MSELRVTEAGVAMRQSIIEFASRDTYSHWVTLNFHDNYSLATAQKRLQLWARNVVSRLFKNSQWCCSKVRKNFRFLAFPEFTKSGDIHYHILIFVSANRRLWFERVVAAMWKNIVPTGSADVQTIKQTSEDLYRVINYATKCADRPISYNNFIETGMCFNELTLYQN